jgi:HEAT repeat protein
VVERVSDSSELVRRRAAENLGVMRAQDAVLSLAMLSSLDNEPDQAVRAAAVASLGQIADPSGKEAVEAAQEDPDSFVRDAARIALRRF